MVATYPQVQATTYDVRMASDFLYGGRKADGSRLAEALLEALHEQPDADPLGLFGEAVQSWLGHDAASLIAAVQRYEAQEYGCDNCYDAPRACRECREALNGDR